MRLLCCLPLVDKLLLHNLDLARVNLSDVAMVKGVCSSHLGVYPNLSIGHVLLLGVLRQDRNHRVLLLLPDAGVLNLSYARQATRAMSHRWVLPWSLHLGVVVGALVIGPIVLVVALAEGWSKVAIVLFRIVADHRVLLVYLGVVSLSGNDVQLPRKVGLKILEVEGKCDIGVQMLH